MKKFLTILMLFAAAMIINASDNAVKTVVNDYQRNISELRLQEALALCSKDFADYSAKGKVHHYGEMVQLAQAMPLMTKAAAADATIFDMFNFYTQAVFGRAPTAAEKQSVTRDALNPQRQQQFKLQHAKLRQEFLKMQTSLQTAWQTYRLLNCQIDGNQATVICRSFSTTENKLEEYTIKLVKTDRWLLKESRAVFVEVDQTTPANALKTMLNAVAAKDIALVWDLLDPASRQLLTQQAASPAAAKLALQKAINEQLDEKAYTALVKQLQDRNALNKLIERVLTTGYISENLVQTDGKWFFKKIK